MRRLLLPIGALIALAIAGSSAQAQVLLAGYVESSIRKYTEAGVEQSPLVAPGGASGVVAPAGIAFGPGGFLYVANQTSQFAAGAPDSIVKVNPTTGQVTPFITLASGYVPGGLAFGPDGFLYVTQNRGQGSAAGSGSVDRFNATTGALVNTPVTNLSQPTAMLFDGSGNLLVSNFGAGNIVKYNGTIQTTFAGAGTGASGLTDPGLSGPAGMRIGADGKLYVADLLVGAVRRYNAATGAFDTNFISAGGQLSNQFPSDLLFDRLGHLLVADLGGDFTSDPAKGNIKEFDALTGAFITNFATGIQGASQLALTPVPEPTSLILGGLAVAGFTFVARRRRRAAAAAVASAAA